MEQMVYLDILKFADLLNVQLPISRWKKDVSSSQTDRSQVDLKETHRGRKQNLKPTSHPNACNTDSTPQEASCCNLKPAIIYTCKSRPAKNSSLTALPQKEPVFQIQEAGTSSMTTLDISVFLAWVLPQATLS